MEFYHVWKFHDDTICASQYISIDSKRFWLRLFQPVFRFHWTSLWLDDLLKSNNGLGHTALQMTEWMFIISKLPHEICLIMHRWTAVCLVYCIWDDIFKSEIIYNPLEKDIKDSYCVNTHFGTACQMSTFQTWVVAFPYLSHCLWFCN